MASEPERTYPSELPVVALRETVVFPLTLQPLAINRPMSIDSVNRALSGDRLMFLTLQSTDKDEPDPADLHPVDLRFRCIVCGAEVVMTTAAGDDPEAPRHCREDMVLIGGG